MQTWMDQEFKSLHFVGRRGERVRIEEERGRGGRGREEEASE